MIASEIKTMDQTASISSSPERRLGPGTDLGLAFGLGTGTNLGLALGLALSLAMSFLPPPFAAQGRDKPQAAPSVQSHDHRLDPVQYYDLVFPPGHPLAVINWTIREYKNGRAFPLQLSALARGTVRVPTNCPMSLSLKSDAVEQIDLLDQFAHCCVVSIDASRLDFTDAHLAHLKNFSYLNNLNLGETLISDKGLLLLGAMPGLTHLSLSRNDITRHNIRQSGQPASYVLPQFDRCSAKKGQSGQTHSAASKPPISGPFRGWADQGGWSYIADPRPHRLAGSDK